MTGTLDLLRERETGDRTGTGARSSGGANDTPPKEWATLLGVGLAVVVVVGVVLRFWARSDLWLDEALTLNIARLPLSHLDAALRRDGAPPLYYVLLHFWTGAFGTSDLAVRSLSGLLGCLTVPFVWVAGRRLGGRATATAAVVVLLSSPFAVRYSTENRMYALVMLLVAMGVVALQGVLERPRIGNLVALGLCTAGLLYSHYWAFYLVGTTVLWLGFEWRWGRVERRPKAFKAMIAVLAGCLSFLPWYPTFAYQSAHTGTPWVHLVDPSSMITAVISLAGPAISLGRPLSLLYVGLAVLGLCGVAMTASRMEIDLRTRPKGRPFAIVAGGTLCAAYVGSRLMSSAIEPRYLAVVFVPGLLLIALGVAFFADWRLRFGVLGVVALLGLVGSVPNVSASRTQAGQIASVLARHGRAGDVVGFCPDQLGPAVNRLIPAGRYATTTFPRETSPAFVDWVNYAAASGRGDPTAFASHLEALAGPHHQIWMVWEPNYATFAQKCEAVVAQLEASGDYRAHTFVVGLQGVAHANYEGMTLTRFAPK